jgi:hypothetical protein
MSRIRISKTLTNLENGNRYVVSGSGINLSRRLSAYYSEVNIDKH